MRYFEKEEKLKLNLLEHIFLCFLAFLFVFVSMNNFVFTQSPLAEKLNSLFYQGVLNPHFFSIFDILIVILSIYLMLNFRKSIFSSNLFIDGYSDEIAIQFRSIAPPHSGGFPLC